MTLLSWVCCSPAGLMAHHPSALSALAKLVHSPEYLRQQVGNEHVA